MEGGDLCMSSIDERVVGMKFDNAQFEQGTKQTLSSLDALNKGLKLEGATKGLNDIGTAAQNVHLEHLAGAVDDIANHFKAMSVVAITALANIVTRAVDAGINIGRSLTVDPIKAGLQEFETNMNSIQTILSNTRWQHTGLNDVNKALDELNHYADKTIYNFTQMAKNIGTFTAAGVKLDVATNAIKGIANLAAVSGSNADQASAAMYQLSQAIATGTVKLIDWNSVVNAGLGGKVFQDALIETARVHGVAVDSMIKTEGSFRATLEKGWLSSQILTETLSHFTGDLTKQQLLSMGYTNQQADSIIAMGEDANKAATKVKTLSQLLSTMQEAAGSGWTKTWQLIFGDFGEARDLFTEANDTLGAFIQNSADARNKVLSDWKALGGRTVLIEGIKLAFNDLMEIIHPISLAFRDVFPATTGLQLYNITVAIRDFFSAARHGEDTMTNLRRTFAGVFAIFGIGWDIVKALFGVFADLFHLASTGADGGILDFTARVGDFLVGLRAAIQAGTAFADTFRVIERVLEGPIKIVQYFAKVLGHLFDGFDGTVAAQAVGNFIENIRPFSNLADTISFVWGRVIDSFGAFWHFFEPLAHKFAAVFTEISNSVGGLNFESLLKAINTGAFVTLVEIIRRSFGKKQGISGAIAQLTESLGAMQHALNAAALVEIAIAIGVLAVAISILSKIDTKALAKSLTAIGVMFAELSVTIAALQALPKGGSVRLLLTAAAMIELAAALDIMVIAVKQLSKIDAKALHKGLIGVMILLASITATARLLPPSPGLIATGVALVILAAGIKILASAVLDLAGLSWEGLAKGLSAVGAILLELAIFTRLADVSVRAPFTAAGIVLLAVALNLMADAVQKISTLSWESIGKGLTVLAASLAVMGTALTLIPPSSVFSAAAVLGIAASLGLIANAVQKMGSLEWATIAKGITVLTSALLAIGIAISLIPPTAPLSAAGILIVALALGLLASSIQKMGSMSWTEIAKGLVVLAGSLTIITVALMFMQGALAGAAALVVVSASLVLLAGVMVALGKLSWAEIGKGLVALAGAFIVLGLAGLVLTPVIPTLLGLGLAITLVGAGMALAGAGLLLFSAALTALAVSGAVGTAALVAIVSAVIGLIPSMIQQLGVGLILLVKIIDDAVPILVKTIVDLLLQLFDAIIAISPKLGEALLVVILVLLKILITAIPAFADAGYRIMIGILTAIRNHIQDFIKVGAQVIEKFLKGLGDAIPGLIQAGIDYIIKFINALGVAINNNGGPVGRAIGNLGINIIKGLIKGMWSEASAVDDALISIAKKAVGAFKDFLGISSPSKLFMGYGAFTTQGFAIGQLKNISWVKKSSEKVGATAVEGLKRSLSVISSFIHTDMDLQPKVTPVLDLSSLRRDAGQLDSLLSTKPITPNVSYSSAKQADTSFNNNKATTDQNTAVGGDTFNFTQNNTSPKALSAADIYRQTKNQLATAKGGLPK
jgi:tape measure domain-containing protein